MAKHGDGMTRRMLIVSGGVIGVATAIGWGGGGGGLASGTLDQASRRSPGTPVSPAPPTSPAPAARATPAAPGRARGTGQGRAPRRDRVTHAHLTGNETAEPPVCYVDDGPKVIALTIDDGPSPVYTPQVLRLLAKYRVTASFSMIGQNVSYYPQIAREVADAGHLIVNHTWDHADLTRLSDTRVADEITRAADVIGSVTGTRPRMFRAPYGAWSPAVLQYCANAGLTPLDWSVDPRDWSRPGVGAIVATIMRTTRTGSIILEHDGGGDRSQTVAALKIVIPRLLDEGYRFRAP
jgi:peptidoglycan-N-acetylglucosamine deacetylase